MLPERRQYSLLKHTEPEAAQRMLVAIADLRVELLHAATGYGLASAMSAGGNVRIREWREWLEWTEGLVERVWVRAEELRRMMGEDADREDAPDWPAQLLESVRHFEESGAEPSGELWAAANWREALERLVERARTLEELKCEPLGEIEGQEFGDGVALLGAVEDSLVLVLSDDENKHDLRLSSEEMFDIVLAGRSEGVWDYFEDLFNTE